MPAHSLCCSEPEFPPKQTSGFYSVDWPLAVYAPVSGVRCDVQCNRQFWRGEWRVRGGEFAKLGMCRRPLTRVRAFQGVEGFEFRPP